MKCTTKTGIIYYMYHWSVDEEKFKKENPGKYKIWKVEQLINYGSDDEKLNEEEVKRVWAKIKNQLDPDRRKTVEFLIWGKKWHKEKGLRADRKNFWQWYFKRPTSSRNSI